MWILIRLKGMIPTIKSGQVAYAVTVSEQADYSDTHTFLPRQL